MNGHLKIAAKSLAVFCAFAMSDLAGASSAQVQLTKHVPLKAMAKSVDLGLANADQVVSLAIPMQPQNLAALQTLIERQQTPGDAFYHQYLTSAQFTAQFAPTQAQYASVVSSLQSKGLTNIKTSPSRMLINVTANVSQVEKAFNIQMHRFVASDGRSVFASTVEPTVDASVANLIFGVVGLNNFAKPRTYFTRSTLASAPGNGPSVGGLTAANVKTAYNLTGISQTGQGQTLGLAEFDGYTASDVTAYTKSNNIGTPTLKNVLIDGATGKPSSGEDSGAVEVTLDIELMAALAPASTVMVYEAPLPTTESSFETEVVDVYSRIASDNLAKAVSTSWGTAEDSEENATQQGENTAFMQMASQGQSMFAASGDSGAYDDGSTLGVDDPGSQPYVSGAGGTHLNLTSALAYESESSWNTSAVNSSNGPEGGGGGISSVWTIPSYQSGLSVSANKGSTTMRMVPDVALDGDPASGYSFYYAGQWGVVGGTSCVAPLMASFVGIVNQARASSGLSSLGYFNAIVYQIGKSSSYNSVMHDVNDNSTNLYYPAVTGYDLSTGWGSIIGQPLFNMLIIEPSST